MLLEVTGLKASYARREVLHGIDLAVDKGDVVAVIGPSGSGKTTLLRTLNFLEPADAGSLFFAGESHDMAHMKRADILAIRRRTAFVFQNYNLFLNKTALENITEGQRVESFALEYRQGDTWLTAAEGTTIGYKRILRFPGITTQDIRIVIRQSRDLPQIATVGLYQSSPEEVETTK